MCFLDFCVVRNMEYFAPQNRQINIRFHSGAEDRSWPLSALQGESWNCEMNWSLLLGVTSHSKTIIHCQRSARFPQGKNTHCDTITSHLYSFTSINNALFAVELWCCRHVFFRSDLHGSNWSELVWPIGNVQMFRDLSCLLGFCRVCPQNFPDKGLKILPIRLGVMVVVGVGAHLHFLF